SQRQRRWLRQDRRAVRALRDGRGIPAKHGSSATRRPFARTRAAREDCHSTARGQDHRYGYYRRLVEKASAWMTPRLFREVPTLDPAGQHLLLRHDVDCSLTEALQLAHFEARLGLRSSYFVMMHSLLYDVGQSSAVRELAAM